jgi:protein required for attachment to host cells
VLVAAPRFLAAIRSHLSKTAQKRIARELPRDLVDLPALELRRRLTAAMRRI